MHNHTNTSNHNNKSRKHRKQNFTWLDIGPLHTKYFMWELFIKKALDHLIEEKMSFANLNGGDLSIIYPTTKNCRSKTQGRKPNHQNNGRNYAEYQNKTKSIRWMIIHRTLKTPQAAKKWIIDLMVEESQI